ncbi:MAG: 3-oxoacyl-[acyl-carrier-protein] reductase [Halanaerobiales bacterium]|nr:3-oxoacyl-[acyl-carrier-protein] reductase [Halanaerobiales bacterium]
MRFKDQVALITGGNRGIGASITVELAKEGASVIVFYRRNHRAAEEVRKMLEECNANYKFMSVDIADYKQVAESVEEIVKHFGKIDILVNNAGTTRDNLFKKMSEEDWNMVIETNLNGVFNCTQSVLPHMINQQSGKIMNISSVSSYFGNIGQTNYCAAKAGIIGLTRSLAVEVAKKGIRVNAVAPGATATDMLAKVPDKIIQRFIDRIPLRKLAEVEDIANAVLFLASDDAHYINGQILAVCGGLTLVGF